MQWILLIVWSAAVLFCTHRTPHAQKLRFAIAAALAASMLTQLYLLNLDGMLSLETALPLHLCGLFGVLSIPMLWRAPDFLWEALCFLASPAAFCTLFFPAVIASSHPVLMKFAFSQLHVLITLVPLFLWRTGKPLPADPKRTLLLGNGYLLFIALFNRAFHTNYLFLRAVPASTPLALFFSRGAAWYVCALELLCMLVFTWLKPVFTAGNTSSYSRCSHCTAPCTSRGRG